MPSLPGTNLTRRCLSAPALLLLFLFSSLALADIRQDIPTLKPEPIYGDTARAIVRQLESEHYVNLRLNSDLSNQLFDNYLSAIDPARLFLLQSDIDAFSDRRAALDRELRNGNVQSAYIIYNRFLERSIERVENTIATLDETVKTFDFTVDEYLELDRSEAAWPANNKDADELWRKQLKNRVLSLKIAGQDDADIIELLKKRYQSQLHRMRQTSAEDVFQVYMNSLASLYDPHTNYYSPRLSQNFQINMSLRLEGIGAVLQSDDEFTKVVRLVPAGPAQRQGELQPADRIVGVAEGEKGEFQEVVGWRLDDVVDLIRGPKGTYVRLEVIPFAARTDDERRVITIERNEVKLEEQSAKKRMIHIPDNDDGVHKIGVIEIPTFYLDFEALRRGDPEFRSTTRDAKRLLDELLADGAEGIIIDLRDNGGGSLSEANALTGLFIQSGPTVQIRYANSWIKREGKRQHTPYYDGPLAVMINRMSASASEIFAGAIQDYQRGIVIGNASYGKGTVQSINQLRHGQLKLTESKFYRISGKSTQSRGVVPDITFPSIHDEERIGESTLRNAMEWDQIAAIQFTPYFDISAALPLLKKAHHSRASQDPDFTFLREQIQHIEAFGQQTHVSLHKEKRQAEREERRKLQLALENKRRVAKGLKPLAALDDSSDNPDLAEAAPMPEAKDDKDDLPDPMLIEAGHILVDAIPVYNHERLAKSLPAS